jgi:hypothetical protein
MLLNFSSAEDFTLEEMDDDSDLMDLSDWGIPKVRFVEERKSKGSWILHPPEKAT